MLALCNYVTPNETEFEAERITGIRVTDLTSTTYAAANHVP